MECLAALATTLPLDGSESGDCGEVNGDSEHQAATTSVESSSEVGGDLLSEATSITDRPLQEFLQGMEEEYGEWMVEK